MPFRFISLLLILSTAFVAVAPARAGQDPVVVGVIPNDGKGDSFRNAMIKLNKNDSELYNAIGTVNASLSAIRGSMPVIDQNGTVRFPNGPTIGAYQSGKFISQPDKIQILGPGSTGDISGMNVTPTGSVSSATLADLIVSRAPVNNPVFNGSLLVTPGTVTPQIIYTSAFPGVSFSDTSQSVLDVVPGDQRDNLSAVAGYVRTRSGGAGFLGKGNAVALFGSAQIAADNSAAWGLNTLCTDNTSRVAFNGAGRICTGAELDFNIMSPNTHINGVSVGGNSLVQPTNANAFIANSLGTGIKWNAGFWSFDGAAQYAFIAGPLETSGTNIGSQPIFLQYFDGSGAKQTTQIQSIAGFAVISGAPNGLKISNGSVGVDPGYGFTVGGVGVVGARRTGWTAGTGTPNRGVYNADYTQTIAASYSQTQIQSLQNQLLATQQRLLALETDLRAHGLIGP